MFTLLTKNFLIFFALMRFGVVLSSALFYRMKTIMDQTSQESPHPIPGYPNLKTSGRPKGAQNKLTVTFRETVTKLLDDNSQNVGLWLTRVAEHDPGKALDLMAKLAEYAAPKLSKVEVSGDVEITHGYAFHIERPSRPAIEGESARVHELPTPETDSSGLSAQVLDFQPVDK